MNGAEHERILRWVGLGPEFRGASSVTNFHGHGAASYTTTHTYSLSTTLRARLYYKARSSTYQSVEARQEEPEALSI